MANVTLRQSIERRIVGRIVADALAMGYLVSVNDGEETTLKRSTDRKAIIAAMFTTDEDRLLFHHPDQKEAFGWIYLVYGNDGWDVVNDYTTNLSVLMTGAERLAETLEATFG
jgi:hypothetical protein